MAVTKAKAPTADRNRDTERETEDALRGRKGKDEGKTTKPNTTLKPKQ